MYPATQSIKVGSPVKVLGKRGTVVRTVLPEENPKSKIQSLLKTGRYTAKVNSVSPRKERSYLISIISDPKSRAKKLLLWPKLEVIKAI